MNAPDTERVELNLRGAGRIEVTGNRQLLLARLGGIRTPEARALRADAVDLSMSGRPGSASVYAKTSATLAQRHRLGDCARQTRQPQATSGGMGSAWH